MKIIPAKSNDVIASEWDQLAELRRQQISSGLDLTYSKFLLPHILKMAQPFEGRSVLDVGCGIGVLTHAVAKQAKCVVGIDPSSESIALARRTARADNLSFEHTTLEDYAVSSPAKYDCAIANMTMSCVLNVDDFVSAIFSILKSNGHFAFSVPHPCFWPAYYGYDTNPDFRYERQQVVEAPFKISNDVSNNLLSTHVHRSLSCYFEALHNAGLIIKTFSEPMPDQVLEDQYPAKWIKPRYLFCRCAIN